MEWNGTRNRIVGVTERPPSPDVSRKSYSLTSGPRAFNAPLGSLFLGPASVRTIPTGVKELARLRENRNALRLLSLD